MILLILFVAVMLLWALSLIPALTLRMGLMAWWLPLIAVALLFGVCHGFRFG